MKIKISISMINLKINKYLSRKIFLSTENKIPFKTVIYIRHEYKVRISMKKCLFYDFFMSLVLT